MCGCPGIHHPFSHTTIATSVASEICLIIAAGMQHEGQINAIHIATVHKFQFTAIIANGTCLAQRFAIGNLNQFFSRDKHQTNGTAQAIKGSGCPQCCCQTNHSRTLGMMAAGMGVSVDRLGMGRRNQRIQFAEDQNMGPRPSCGQICVKPGYISGFDQCIAQLFKNICQIG